MAHYQADCHTTRLLLLLAATALLQPRLSLCWELQTLSTDIVNGSTAQRVRLKCENVVYHESNNEISKITYNNTIKQTYYIQYKITNCVRVCLSVEQILNNKSMRQITDFITHIASQTLNTEYHNTNNSKNQQYQQPLIIVAIDRIVANTSDPGIWYGSGYTPFDWMNALKAIALEVADMEQVIGIDLFSKTHDQLSNNVIW